MANEFKVKNGLIVVGDLTTSGTITINGALAATQSWVTSQGYLTSASLSGYATQSYVTSAIAALVDSAPAALDTLNELAAALGDDANFSTTITTSIGNKVSKSGDTMTGSLLFTAVANNVRLEKSGSFLNLLDTYSNIHLYNGGDGIYIDSNVHYWRSQGATHWMALNSTGLGIGTQSPETKFHVAGGKITLKGGSSTDQQIVFNYAREYVNGIYNSSGHFRLQDNSLAGTVYQWDGSTFAFPNGNIGIGTTSPGTKLEVNGGATGNNIARFTTGGIGGGTRGLTMYSDSSQVKLQVSDNAGGIGTWAFLNLNPDGGNVGIGTTNPIYKLQIAGSTYVNGGTLFLDSDQYLRWGNSNQGIVGSNDNHVSIVSGGATRQSIYADGRTYFPGLDLSISNVNSTHGTANYFRGDTSHLVIGTGGTLYLNYGGSTTNITGTTYINGNLVWHAGNDGSGSGLDADLLDGNHASYFINTSNIGSQSVASATTSTSTYRGIIEDTRAAERTPNDYDDYRVSWEFTNQIPGLNYSGASWWSAMTMQGWHNGYSAWQIIGSASSAIDDFYLRAGNNTTWNTARRIWHSGDFTSTNVSSWNTAYSWGNHANAGYLTSVSDVWVNTTGDTMTGNLNFGATSNLGLTWGLNTDAAFIRFTSTGNGAGQSYLEIGTQDDSDEEIKFTQSGNVRFYLATDGFLKNGSGYKYVFENGTWGINISGNANTATTFSTTRSNYKGVTDGAVAGQLMWKNYGNGHTIFDASQGTSPDGGSINNTNSAAAWSATYPTLMGWNGSQTYGVRVDSARIADSATTASTANYANTAGSTSYATTAGALTSMNISQFTNNSGYVAYGNYSWTSPVFGQYGIKSNLIDNVLYSAADRFEVFKDGVAWNTNCLFALNYDNNCDVIPTSTSRTYSIVLNTKGNGSSGITYTEGNVYLSFYYVYIPASVSGRVRFQNGTWVDMSGWTNVANNVSYAVWRGNVPGGNYMVEIEITITASASINTWFAQWEYVMGRPGQYELGIINKAQDNSLWRNMYFRDSSNNVQVSIGASGLSTSQNLNISGTSALTFGSYGGGFYMQDSSWIRTVNYKSIWTQTGLLGTDGGLTVGYGGNTPPSGGAIISGNVGIGTTSPTQKLHVVGKGIFESNIRIYPVSESWAEGLSFIMPTTSNWGGLRWQRQRGNNDGNWYVGFTALDSSDDLVFGANNGGSQVDNIIRLTKAGNVGIGTSSPSFKLDINGNSRTTGIHYVDTYLVTPYIYGAGPITMGNNVFINSTEDGKLTLRVPSGDSSEWNYINFTGSNGVRDAYLGTDGGGTPTWYRDDNGVNITLSSSVLINGNTAWHAGNDGSGSGLDADLLDGVDSGSFLRSDVSDSFSGTLTMATQRALVPSNYGYGLYGIYSAERYQHVWSMGAGYDLPADGASNGNGGSLYGLAWSYNPDYSYVGSNAQAKPGLNHQLLLMMNGITYTALGNGIWTSGTITTVSHGTSSQWNTAFGWGNHASAGYLTSVTAHTQAWSTITSTPTTISGYGITNAYTDTQIQNFFNGANAISGYNKSNWDTAYGWGNHASAGYLTSASLSGYATTSYVTTQINNLIAGAPGALDTLDELAAALGDDANFATTVTNSIAGKVSKSGDTMTGALTLNAGLNAYASPIYVNEIRFRDTAGSPASDPYSMRWISEASARGAGSSWLEFQLNDDSTEEIRIYGNSCAGYGCGSVSENLYHVFRADGYAWHAGNLVVVGTISASGYNSGNWDTAYGWGNHSSAGYALNSALANYLPLSGGSIGGALTVNGNLTVNGTITENSSIKLKENVETSEGNLEKVVNLRPVTYNKIGSQTTELGLIAEEVAEVYPEFVQYDENGDPIGVHYSRLTAALIGAVKELTNQVQELNKKING
jgi:hypothetical protein